MLKKIAVHAAAPNFHATSLFSFSLLPAKSIWRANLRTLLLQKQLGQWANSVGVCKFSATADFSGKRR
jgi:hypothetical protein